MLARSPGGWSCNQLRFPDMRKWSAEKLKHPHSHTACRFVGSCSRMFFVPESGSQGSQMLTRANITILNWRDISTLLVWPPGFLAFLDFSFILIFCTWQALCSRWHLRLWGGGAPWPDSPLLCIPWNRHLLYRLLQVQASDFLLGSHAALISIHKVCRGMTPLPAPGVTTDASVANESDAKDFNGLFWEQEAVFSPGPQNL